MTLNNGTSNTLAFGTAGLAAPSYTTTSAGTRLQLFPAEGASAVDWSIGMNAGSIWYAASQAISGHAHIFYGGTNELMRIRGDGNVGIGTISPTQKLHVYTTTSGDGVMADGNTNVGFMLAAGGTQKGAFGYAQTAGSWSTDAAIGDVVLRSSSSQKLMFNTNGGTGSSTMYLTGTNVNIPGLAVNSAVYTDGSHNLTTTPPTGGLQWNTTGNTGTTPTPYADNGAQANNFIGTTDNNAFYIYTNSSAANNKTSLGLLTSTSTGAAVTTPADILQVRRNGTAGVNFPQVASFALGKYGSTINSETQLSIKLGAAGVYAPDVTVMTMNANGTVGIGTTTPGNNLLNVSSSATNAYGIYLAAQAGSGGSSGGSVTIASGTNGSSSNGGGGGNINITAANASSSSFGVSGGTVNISAGSAYNAGGSGAGGNVNITAGGNQLGASSYGNINFYTYANSGTTTSQAMFISGSNNYIGFGTTSPAVQHHVVGSGIFTGTLYVNATGTGTTSGATGTVQIGDGQITKSFGSGFVMNSTLSVATGYQIGGAAASGNYLRGNGANFVASTIPASDLSAGINGTTNYHAKFTGTNTVGSSGVVYETGSTLGINTTTTSGAISFATSGTNNITWGTGPFTSIYDNGNIHYYTDDATNFESGATGASAVWSWVAGRTATGTGGSTWMTLTNGQLGIGTVSPSTALDVVGDITAENAIYGNFNVGKINTYASYGTSGTDGLNAVINFHGNRAFSGYDSDNSDPQWIGRVNYSANQTGLFVNVGDDSDNGDALYVGITQSNTYYRKWYAGGAGGYGSYSDIRLKKKVKPMSNVLSRLLTLNGVTYNWKEQTDTARPIIGFIAQDIQKVFPEMVETDESGYLRVNHGSFPGIFIEAFKEQQAQIDQIKEDAGQTSYKALEQKYNSLKEEVDALKLLLEKSGVKLH